MFKQIHNSYFIIHASLLVIGFCLLAYIIFVRYQLGLTRYFDPDELAYLNWGAHIAVGQQPYVDFMLQTTPGFVWLVSLLFHFASGLTPVMWGRVLALVISLVWAGALGYLFWQIRRSWLAILVPIIFLLLPMPGDKLLEIRPDNLAMALFTIGLIFAVSWFKKERRLSIWFSGIFFGLSILTLQKTIPQIAWAMTQISLVALRERHRWESSKLLFTGLLLPLVLFGLWAIVTKHPNLVWYSVVNLPFETSVVSKFNASDLWFYFQPNSIYYGQWGKGIGWIFNHSLWLLAIFIAFSRFIVAFLAKTKERSAELLFTGSFFVAIIIYITSPLKHPQYLLPAMGFIAWYAVDGVYLLFKKISYLGYLGYLGILILSLFLVQSVWIPKLAWTNATTQQKMLYLWKTIPKGEPVLDLEGRSLYYPYPYYVCCLSFGQFGAGLSQPLPPLIESLKKSKTKYIYQAEINRIGALLPIDRDYILSHYTPTMNGELYVAK